MLFRSRSLTVNLLNPSFCFNECAIAIPLGPAPIITTSMIVWMLAIKMCRLRVDCIEPRLKILKLENGQEQITQLVRHTKRFGKEWGLKFQKFENLKQARLVVRTTTRERYASRPIPIFAPYKGD